MMAVLMVVLGVNFVVYALEGVTRSPGARRALAHANSALLGLFALDLVLRHHVTRNVLADLFEHERLADADPRRDRNTLDDLHRSAVRTAE